MAKSGISDQLKSTMLKAFGKQRDFAEQFERNFPIIQKKLTDLANIQAGHTMSIENLAGVVKELQIIVETFRSLADRGEEAVLETVIATMRLKELEAEPAEIAETLVDVATILANADVFMQSSVDFVLQTVEMALPQTRQEAMQKLTLDKLVAWADDISGELKRRHA